MKVNNIEWAACPKCKVLMNGYQFYPANIVMQGPSDMYCEMTCPNKKCGEKILITASIQIIFDAIELEA